MTLRATAIPRWATTEGLPYLLGPTRLAKEHAFNFALYSHAESGEKE